MKFLVVTNRKFLNAKANEKIFGESPHSLGPGELRLAWAEKTSGRWKVELIPETKNQRITVSKPPSQLAFEEYRNTLIEKNMDCVFYVHGYNKSFEESLEQAHKIQQLYGTGVVGFSWPSNPGGFISNEYDRARAIARASNIALDRIFEKMEQYVRECLSEECNISFNLLVHSLGNYLFKGFVDAPIFSGETRFFDNIVIHQADVDNKNHASWVDKLRYSRRVYVTLNERDFVLGASELKNPDRLGNTLGRLNSKRATYVNFTNAKNIRKTHQIFGDGADKNKNIKDFFQRAFNGGQAEAGNGVSFDGDTNTHNVS